MFRSLSGPSVISPHEEIARQIELLDQVCRDAPGRRSIIGLETAGSRPQAHLCG